jgi:hypothetical protein
MQLVKLREPYIKYGFIWPYGAVTIDFPPIVGGA